MLDHLFLYRLPWNLSDNAILWLEPTKECNLACRGCFLSNRPDSHKSLDEIEQELETACRARKADTVTIAGGEPLTHPQIEDIVRAVARRGMKPLILTNGLLITYLLLRRLKRAGLKGITFHVDSQQRRRGWAGKNEQALNALRLELAEQVALVGGLSCGFHATVYENTLAEIPDIVNWGQRHIDKVHFLLFITFRSLADGRFDWYAGKDRVNPALIPSGREWAERVNLTSREVAGILQQRCAPFEPSAFLNGTEQSDALKWLLTVRLGTPEHLAGCAGPKFVEMVQMGTHLLTGKYLGHGGSRTHRWGRRIFLLAFWDKGVRQAAWNFIKQAARRPLNLFQPVYLQTVLIIQPMDVLADGRISMCDGCPDITVYEGELAWSCRLDERRQFGQWISLNPKKQETSGVDEVIRAMAGEA